MDKNEAIRRLRCLSPLLDECVALDPTTPPRRRRSQSDLQPALRPLLRRLMSERASTRFGEFLSNTPILPVVNDAPAPWPGCQVGPYQLVRQLGQGGMSTVWLAHEPFHRRPVAIKLQRMAPCADATGQVAHERNMTALMAHPRVARQLDAGTDDRFGDYLVLRFVDGASLSGLPVLGDPDPAHRLAMFVRMADLVAHVHERGVVHRDLKPSNFMLTADGDVHLIDFGIAMPIGATPSAASRAARCQTPAYASPEQSGAPVVTAASDVYSLGVMLWELMTGQRPAAEMDGTARAHVDSECDAEGWRRVASKALAPRPSDRFANARELAIALRELDGSDRSSRSQALTDPPAQTCERLH